jgi:hypothetical protein
MRNVIEGYAPWALPDADGFIDRILHMPPWERRLKPEELGQRTGCTNAEREALRLWLIAPVDRTAEQLAEQRRAKKRERDRKRRRKKGQPTRAEYRANFVQSISKRKPWFALGISRATWYRCETRLAPNKLYKTDANPVSRLALSKRTRASSKKSEVNSGRSPPDTLTSGNAHTIEVGVPLALTVSHHHGSQRETQ